MVDLLFCIRNHGVLKNCPVHPAWVQKVEFKKKILFFFSRKFSFERHLRVIRGDNYHVLYSKANTLRRRSTRVILSRTVRLSQAFTNMEKYYRTGQLTCSPPLIPHKNIDVLSSYDINIIFTVNQIFFE